MIVALERGPATEADSVSISLKKKEDLLVGAHTSTKNNNWAVTSENETIEEIDTEKEKAKSK